MELQNTEITRAIDWLTQAARAFGYEDECGEAADADEALQKMRRAHYRLVELVASLEADRDKLINERAESVMEEAAACCFNVKRHLTQEVATMKLVVDAAIELAKILQSLRPVSVAFLEAVETYERSTALPQGTPPIQDSP